MRDGGGAERDLLQGGGLHGEGRQGKGHYHHYHFYDYMYYQILGHYHHYHFHYYMYYQILEPYRNYHYCSLVGLKKIIIKIVLHFLLLLSTSSAHNIFLLHVVTAGKLGTHFKFLRNFKLLVTNSIKITKSVN